jgi:carbamoyl-phosphate synthase large subunit
MNVAITGVGGGVGQSIMKALTLSTLPIKIFPIDVSPFSAGLYRGAVATILPKSELAESKNIWQEWLRANQITALIPGSDHDLIPLANFRDDWAARGICQTLVSDAELTRICRDKARTTETLTRLGLPAPRSIWDVTLDDARAWADAQGYPVVIKPRHGSASRYLAIAQNAAELEFYFPRTPEPIVQEYLHLNGDVQEFTCAVFVDKAGEPRGVFMARRDLSAGSTYRAEVKFFPELEELLLKIGRALKPRGPINVQLRLTERGPVPFELNLRCSGTTSIRAHFGYNEPDMLLRHYVLGEAVTAPRVRAGFALRYWNEVFIEAADRDALLQNPAQFEGTVRAWP